MSIVNQSNKEMLFDLLKSIGAENNFLINEKELARFINQKCAYYHTNRYNFEFGRNLEEVNKKIIGEAYNFIMSNQPRNSSPPEQQTPVMTKREMFDTGLANQEAQFKKMINPKKPKEIDFSDGSEDFPIQNLDQIMNQTLADRQKELESITQRYSSNDKEKAQKWLNRDENETPKIKIENSTNLILDNAIDVSKQKKVRFTVEEKSKPLGLNSLFSKLKQKKEVTNNDIISKLDVIISNQEKILEFLSDKKEKTMELEAI
tara:strand:+ start:38 stop:820 length:783 start_codon:yes stop_codon:yes gene_type:complete